MQHAVIVVSKGKHWIEDGDTTRVPSFSSSNLFPLFFFTFTYYQPILGFSRSTNCTLLAPRMRDKCDIFYGFTLDEERRVVIMESKFLTSPLRYKVRDRDLFRVRAPCKIKLFLPLCEIKESFSEMVATALS